MKTRMAMEYRIFESSLQGRILQIPTACSGCGSRGANLEDVSIGTASRGSSIRSRCLLTWHRGRILAAPGLRPERRTRHRSAATCTRNTIGCCVCDDERYAKRTEEIRSGSAVDCINGARQCLFSFGSVEHS